MSHKPLTKKQLEDAKRMYTMAGGTYGAAERVIEHVAAIAFENGLAFSAGHRSFHDWAESEGLDMSVDWKGDLTSPVSAAALRGWEAARSAASQAKDERK
ncbi:hypothetical protein LV28_18890 [Pandoraea pnomenusa]|uniref:Uncharacterized protein n=1 Tax=Pandoraea pnomenusa TaxID=93220 RepID=A0A378YVC8_9BURK|nr:hypothetical protein [Pandoraea pnomenusa]AIU28359.1 hypothetical protein LV28_18890 [Pandoraea pnomenusa]SUA80411.1 Uncharacterised protein [Pandoraea pnomenusa]